MKILTIFIIISSTLYSTSSYIGIGEAPPSLVEKSERTFSERDHYFNPILESTVKYTKLPDSSSSLSSSYYYNRWISSQALFNIGFIGGYKFFHIENLFDLRYDYLIGEGNRSFFNIPSGDLWYQEFDFNFPTRGFIYLGEENLNLTLGRDSINFGPGKRTSLFISRESSFFNQLFLTYRGRKLNTYFYLIPLESYLTDKEKEDILEFLDSDSSDKWRVKFHKDYDSQSKIIAGNRFEFHLARNFILSLNDMILLGGRVASFEDITPTMFYHNIYGENYSNVMVGVDALWVPLSNLSIYGELIVDDIRNSHEDSISVPTSLGYLLGSSYIINSSLGEFVINLEGSIVDEFTYRRWSKLQDFTNRRKYFSITQDKRVIDSYIGSYLGPGSRYLSLWIEYSRSENLTGSLGGEILEYSIEEYMTPLELIEAYESSYSWSKNSLFKIFYNISYTFLQDFTLKLENEIYLGSSVDLYLSISLGYSGL